jgi:hypothetical protein
MKPLVSLDDSYTLDAKQQLISLKKVKVISFTDYYDDRCLIKTCHTILESVRKTAFNKHDGMPQHPN